MPSFKSFVTLSAFIAATSAYAIPVALAPRAEICGTAPTATGYQASIASPTGITTAMACQAQCDSNSACASFSFGMVNGVDECNLYSVAAALIPKTNADKIVVYDKSCSGVPAVVPTTANPQGLATTTTNGSNNNANNNKSNGAAKTNGAKQNRDIDIISRAVCGVAPSGPASAAGGASPYQTLKVATLADCKAKCVAAGAESCQSYEFGNNQCMLFASAASKIPANTNGQYMAYDISGC